MIIQLPEHVKNIIETLERAGYEAYAVGGCVRDSLLGRIPNDWDITTSADPYQVKALFPRTFDTGIQHGTVTVLMDHVGYEVTTYRIDGKYEDGRHPTEVLFTRNLEEDLLRRDFTINAMAYNESRGLVDIFGGIKDMEEGIIRCVGDPYARFEEDALRLLRAVRFAAQLSYSIEEETRKAMKALAPNLRKISAERIMVELVKMIVSPNPSMLREAYACGLTAEFLPEFDSIMEMKQNNPHHCYTVGEHTIKAMEQVPAEKELRLAMLFHDMGKPSCKTVDEEGIDHFYGHPEKSEEMAGKILSRLRFDNETKTRVCRLVRYHDERIEGGEKYMRRAIARIGAEYFPEIFSVWVGDILAQSDYKRDEKLSRVKQNRMDYESIMEKRQCISRDTLAVKGGELIQAGMKPGKEIGEVLNRMLEEVIENPERNDKEYLLEKYCPGYKN
ncbi:MAG: CCA tRNA nucleotidyltransferase [Lachnospiraceae bacterium]|nr:CCA tRNA nucleotidyltransferase [Lachnospiraceae bacterium]